MQKYTANKRAHAKSCLNKDVLGMNQMQLQFGIPALDERSADSD